MNERRFGRACNVMEQAGGARRAGGVAGGISAGIAGGIGGLRRAVMRAAIVVAGAGGVALGLGVIGGESAVAQSRREIPAEWFYDGANRPKELKAVEGKPAAALSGETWIGDAATIEGSLGKVVIVDFWATWCGPCMAAIPKNVQLVNDYKDKGLVFIGVHDSNSGWERADAVVKEKGINYPVMKDKGGDTTKAYNLQFWPTYVAIDKYGIVRAAGLLPDRVHDVVEMLLAEPGPAGMGGAEGVGGGDGKGGPASWYYAGAARPAWLKGTEGKRLPAFESERWAGGGGAGAEEGAGEGGAKGKVGDLKGKVVVVQFMATGSSVGMSQLAELNKIAPEMGPQGVVFVGVCDSRSAWEGPGGAGAMLAGASASVPVMQDKAVAAAVEKGAGGTEVEADAKNGGAGADGGSEAKGVMIKSGMLAAALGVRLSPTIVIVDRAGMVRAAGVKVEKVKEVINKLLAEPMPESAAAPAAEPVKKP